MELNTILIWMVGANCVMHASVILERFSERWRELAIPAAIAAVLAIAWEVQPSSAGYVGLTAWVLLQLLPLTGNVVISWLLSRKRFRLATLLARGVSIIHPVGEIRHWPLLIQALQLMEHSHTEDGLQKLRELSRRRTPLRDTARVMLARYADEWQHLVKWIQDPRTSRRVLDNPMVLQAYLRGLGELGRREELLREFQRLVLESSEPLPPFLDAILRGEVAAFCGRVDSTILWLSRESSALSPEVHQFWIATALQAAARHPEADSAFELLLDSRDATLARYAAKRLRTPVATGPLPAESEQILARAVAPQLREVETGRTPVPAQFHRRMTVAISLVLLGVFLAEIPVFQRFNSPRIEAPGELWASYEIPGQGRWELRFPGGSESIDKLERMGARIIPTDREDHPWFRILAAAFLHFGPLHFALNTAALWFLGTRVERMWGSLPMLLCYLPAAWGSMALAPMFTRIDLDVDWTILVGASGGVMGLVGGLLAHAGWWWWRHQNSRLGREFRMLAMVITIQTAFDFSTPYVSAAAHLSGLCLGTAFGVVVCWMRDRRLGKRDSRAERREQ